jgi:Zn-dependent metalloprotease
VAWAQWIIGLVAAIVAILGVKTYFDVQNKINATIEKALANANERTTQAINDFTTAKDAALENLKIETDQAKARISEQTTQASAEIALIVGGLPKYIASPPISGLARQVYDAQHEQKLPGKLARSEAAPPTSDDTVNEVYDNIGVTHQFLESAFSLRLSLAGGNVIATVHFGDKYNNGFWNGEQLVLGDGDGEIFLKFSGLDIVAGELCYGIIQEKTKLLFQGMQGALLTHLRDIFSVMAVQWREKQTAIAASWSIGAGAFSSKIDAPALRSMKAPGTAYNNETLGKDPQPARMRDYVTTDEDNGGIHINSGIPNHAFYLASVAVGGFSWERIGMIWVKTLDRLTSSTDFEGFAATTFQTAKDLFGNNSNEAKAVAKAWADVGISVHMRRTRSFRAKNKSVPTVAEHVSEHE